MKLLPLLLLAATPALADETWVAKGGGLVVYERDVGTTAVFSFPMNDGSDQIAWLYIPGIVGNFDRRGVHDAYWIGLDSGACEATLTGPDDMGSTDWGTAVISFDNPTYPTGFDVKLGRCGSAASMSLRADVP